MTKIDKSILITGCSSGIGYHVAMGLHQRGYRVFASARNDDDVDRLRQAGLEAVQLDLDDSSSIHTAVDTILQHTDGQLFALFNNGAYGQPGAVEDLSRDALRAQFETNLFGWLELINLIVPVMRRQGYGRIIQNSSILGLIALPYRGAYNASKFALEGLSDTLRLELRDTDIHVSLIEPGPIESRFRQNAHQAFLRHIQRQHSYHNETYLAMEARLNQTGPIAPFTLPPDAVLKRVQHALQSKKPKIRYYVTVPTYFFAYLRRFVSASLLDKILGLVSKDENKRS